MTRTLSVCTAALAVGLAGAPLAQDYPTRPIQVIVPAAAGGGTDVFARVLQPALEAQLGQPAVVINVDGGGTVIGNRRVHDAEPDGHTVLPIHMALHTTYILGTADFSWQDFETDCGATSTPIVMVVGGESPYETLDDLLSAAKAQPNELIAAANLGAVNHFVSLMITLAAGGAPFRYVQVGGAAPSIAAILGGHAVSGVMTVAEAKPYYDSGELRVLAVTARERVEEMPDVPTTFESGIDVEFALNYWFFTPKGTPREAVVAFCDAVEQAMADPEVRERLRGMGMSPIVSRGAATIADIEHQYDLVLQAARAAGMAQR